VRARALAEEGRSAYPDSPGGRQCLAIIKGFETPEFRLASMSVDGAQRRSVEVTHANLPALYFRAYHYDLESRLASARDYNLLPNAQEQETVLSAQPVAAEWSVTLPATPDFEVHRTFVTPPLKNPGAYVVAASQLRDFGRVAGNRIISVMIIVGNLVVLSRP
jgi:hypothetical protein